MPQSAGSPRFDAPADRRGDPTIGSAMCGNADNPKHRATLFDQGDVDREFAVSADEFLRAVERIDQPESAAGILSTMNLGNTAGRDSLLRHDRNVRQQRAEQRKDQCLGGVVGRCYRRLVGLDAGFDLAVVVVRIASPARPAISSTLANKVSSTLS